MVVPYGPIGPHSRLVYLVNKYRVSLKKCTFINMDEYLAPDGCYLPPEHPLSFIGGMNRIFYSRVDDELNVLPKNRVFPAPGKEDEILRLIEAHGKLDMAWGGVGVNGHYAFNEPPEPGEQVTDDEFLNRATRVLQVSRETITVNSVMNSGGDLDAIPKLCITVGMKEIFISRKGTAKRGAIFTGYYGTVEFDWYTNIVKVYLHNENRRETYQIDGTGSHNGGDEMLVKKFVNVMSGKESSGSMIDEGILSARMCLLAQKSSETGLLYDI